MGKEPFVRDNFAKGFMLSWYPLTRILGIDIYPYWSSTSMIKQKVFGIYE